MSAHFTSTSGTEIFLNLSKEDRALDGTPHVPPNGRAAIELIRSLSAKAPITAEHLLAADTIYDEGVCLSPYSIFELPIHRDICVHINRGSDLGWSLREALDEAGAFDFIDKVRDRSTYDSTIERILAVFTMSAAGLTSISEAPIEFIHAVVDIFRTPDGADWNRKILGVGDVSVQCVSNVIRALSKIFNDDSLLQKARKHRRPSGSTNPGFHAFQYSKDALDQELLGYFRVFMETSRMRPPDAQSALQHIAGWLKLELSCSSVLEIIYKKDRPATFTDWMVRKNNGQVTRTILTVVNAARKISLSITEQLFDSSSGQTMFDLVTEKELAKLKNKVKSLPKPDSARARPLAEKFVPIMREVLEEGAAGWPGKSGHFHEEVIIGGKRRSIYCPVIPSLFQVMLEIPLRMVQIRRLDSGEGDVVNFNADTMEWEDNEGAIAGYWKSINGEGTSKSHARGYAREVYDHIKPIVGINVNTNKTGEPYILPWFIPKVHKILWDLRKWQEKYNPISQHITPKQYVDASSRSPDVTLEEMPDIIPIARLFPNKYHDYDGRVVTYTELHRAWGWILQEIQRRWNLRHPGNPVVLVELHEKSKQPGRYRYSIHGFRVRGLSNLRRGGMPLDIVMRVAGHKSMRMAIYYTEPHALEIAHAIEAAVANAEGQRQYIDDLKKATLDQALGMSVSLHSAAIPEAYVSQSQVQFCSVAIGICPFDGTRCGDGGELLRKEVSGGGEKNVYGPVERRNCIMCRHFISGPPFLMELAAYGTKLCERRQYLVQEQDRINDLVGAYEVALRDAKITQAYFENQTNELQVDLLQVTDELVVVENSIFNVELLCNASQRLLEETSAGEREVLLIAHPRTSVVEFEEISEFKQSVWITAHGRVHTILGDERVERKRDRYLELIAMHSDVRPPSLLTHISDSHRRRAMDQYASFIDAKVPADDIQRLIDGSLRLQDLGLKEQVRELIDVALSSAVPLVGATPERNLLTNEMSV
ncbi:VPA1269 family protein [Agrobacterium leguminum]|uniref:Phage integrase family protein n=1 Tax=Agrobacterium deltaense NCPPB 1641 TaxID=1183425 RepID=A0A1S7TYQ2_9HYPH|nr:MULTISPECIES: VPA1269 family protein [Agrobacterium]WFS67879.1 VPA1269 family protein [Agrobacterium leguminum]CVI59696.1 hypothetical protein AGR7A_Lc120645 [Agrobacterium deltaense NCPPB 1641]